MTQDAPKQPPRLLPALLVTGAVLLGLKTIAFAEGAAQPAETAKPAEQKKSAPAEPAAAGAPPTAPTEPAACTSTFADAAGLSPSEVQILQSLGERRQSLDARAGELETQQELIAAAERRLEQRVAELQRIEAQVQQLLGQVDDEQAKQIASLVDVYQRMRAKDAAAVFDALEEDVLVDVASRMRQQNLAEIMGKMQPDRARALTRLLARRAQIDPTAIRPTG